MLRTNQPEAATAQLVQKLKAKVQSVLAGGDWQASWLLTGLPDPLARKEFAGSKEEMAIISGYMEALAGLKKKIKESSHWQEFKIYRLFTRVSGRPKFSPRTVGEPHFSFPCCATLPADSPDR